VRKILLGMVVILCSFPAVGIAQVDPADHTWAFAYDSTDGITLHRFIGRDWDVFAGGKPSNYKYNYHYLEYELQSDGTSVLVEDRTDQDTSYSGQVHLGVGRTFLSDDRFWMAGIAKVKYTWGEFEYLDFYYFPEEDGSATRGEVGHSHTIRGYLGLRPAYNITSRIVLMLEMGVYFSHYTTTSDTWVDDPDGVSWWHEESERRASSSDKVRLYGYDGIHSIRFMFAF
jgi:hypothetical protein